MSFGLLKQFKDLKKGVATNVIPNHVQHVVLGHDLGAVLKLLEIRRQYPQESVKLISLRPLNRQALIDNYHIGPTTLRSQAAVEALYKRYFNAKITPQTKSATFYKDGKFHDFGGRAKSMDLLPGEHQFTAKGYKLELSSLFNPEDWEYLDEILNDHQEIRLFESIEKTTPTDLVDKGQWLLIFKDFYRLSCENLYLGISPKKFLNLLSNKDELTAELIDLCSSLKIQAGISVTWHLDQQVHSEEGTIFVPQSMTHEWGHFIVEFEPFDYVQKTQLCHVLFLIHDEEAQNEDLASKIKLLKRVLDRVFPDIEKHIAKEFIRFDDEMFITDIKESALEQVGFDYPHLKLFLSRSLLNH